MIAITRNRNNLRGFTVFELVVSASLLVIVMTFTTKMLFRINQTWIEIGHHRLAVNELSNQLDRLTQLPVDQIAAALASIEPSTEANRTLWKAELTADRLTDELGDRIVLSLNWQRRYPGRPVEMVGWLEGNTYRTRNVEE